MNNNTDTEFTGLGMIQDDNNELTCEAYEEFRNALEILYIRGNLGGRLNFLEAWPVAAQRIFGDELIAQDRDGTTDRERRGVLEEEAEERRLALLEHASDVHEKSVDRGSLLVEYVEKVVKELGRDLALLVYSEKVVNRFIPVLADGGASVLDSDEQMDAAAPAVPQTPMQNIPDDIDVDSLGLEQPNDDMARLNTVGEKPEEQGTRRAPRGAFAPEEETNPVEQGGETSTPDLDASKPSLDDVEDELDAIQPISVGENVPEGAKPLPQEPLMQQAAESESHNDGPPTSPQESEYFQPNQWNKSADDKPPPEPIQNDAMSGIKVSQKMSFVPAKKESDDGDKPKSSGIPVIGGSAKSDQAEGE